MKYLLTAIFFLFILHTKAQGDFEVKVTSKRFPTVVGHLKKLSPEGIGIEDDKNQYFIYRPNEIEKIKVRRRGLTILGGLGKGSLIGLGLGAGILSIEDSGTSNNAQLTAAAVVLGVSAVGGTLTGVMSRVLNTKLTLNIRQSEESFKAVYKKLEPYLDTTVIEHVN